MLRLNKSRRPQSENDKTSQQSQRLQNWRLRACCTPLDGTPIPPAGPETRLRQDGYRHPHPKTQTWRTTEPRQYERPRSRPRAAVHARNVERLRAETRFRHSLPQWQNRRGANTCPRPSRQIARFAQTETVEVQAGDETSARTLVRSPDPQVLWRLSSGRYVERSSDAGITWRAQWTSPNAHLVAGAAPTADTCWLVGRDAMILVTTDGKKWKTIAPPTDADFVDVTATDASSATVTSTDGHKFATSDAGRHWNPAP